MPHPQDHVDVQVLEEVERLLTSTSFATIDDLASRLGADEPAARAARAPAPRRSTAVVDAVLVTGEGSSPLPRRR